MTGCADLVRSSGTRVFIGAALPATEDLAGYQGVTWTQIGRIESVGDFGSERAVGSFEDLASDVVCKFLGSRDYGTLDLSLAHTVDAGATALRAAHEDALRRPFMVAFSDYGAKDSATDLWPGVSTGAKSTRYFFPGLVASVKTSPGTGNEVVKVAVSIAITGASVAGAPADSTTP